MSRQPPSASVGTGDGELTQAGADGSILTEIEERIHDLETADEPRFGAFNRLDWIVCTIGSILVPYLLIIWFWP